MYKNETYKTRESFNLRKVNVPVPEQVPKQSF